MPATVAQGPARCSSHGGFGGARWLGRHLDLDYVVLDGVDNQIADGMKTELPHDVAAMRFHRLGAQVEQGSHFLGAFSFC